MMTDDRDAALCARRQELVKHGKAQGALIIKTQTVIEIIYRAQCGLHPGIMFNIHLNKYTHNRAIEGIYESYFQRREALCSGPPGRGERRCDISHVKAVFTSFSRQ